MNDVFYYSTNVEWTEKRKGNLTENTFPKIEVTTPPEFIGGEKNGWTPEHLFVASANVCLMTTFLSIAENSKLDFISYNSQGKGKFEKVEYGFMITEIELSPSIIVAQEKDIARAERIIQKAEHHCLISNSIKSKIILTPKIELAQT
ncbi:MAG: OsmC family peroxiredoxin [Ignavibacteriae bacterium]|nr:OsmC family peroxiredoxin [Ignavibacteriota bacterium]